MLPNFPEAGLVGSLVVGLAAATVAITAARGDDDTRPAQIQKPQLRSATVNARQAIGADEIDGPTILESVPALNGLDFVRDGLRDRYGVYFHGQYVGDPYANLAGGLRRGTTYSGRLGIELDIDAEKAIGVKGGYFHANMFQIHGRDLTADYVGNFLPINDVAALSTTRLYALWYEQKFGDAISLRVGQQGIDVEFLTSNYGAGFINETFGWPGLPAENLPDGGPSYPLATPAARVKLDVSDDLAVLAAVFDGTPAGPCAGEPQTCDRYGLNFRISDPPLAIVETHYRYNRGGGADGLPGTFKLGAFGHFGRFDDQRFASNGAPLNSPRSSGVARSHTRNGGFYGIVDQQVFRLSGTEDGPDGGAEDDAARGVGVFARVIGAPADRNPVDFYIDGGFSALGLVPGRSDDLFGVAAALAKISSVAIASDVDADALPGAPRPVRDFEAVVEATYQAQILPGFTVQPTFQYIFHPGGHIADPTAFAPTPLRDAKVFGATTTVRF